MLSFLRSDFFFRAAGRFWKKIVTPEKAAGVAETSWRKFRRFIKSDESRKPPLTQAKILAKSKTKKSCFQKNPSYFMGVMSGAVSSVVEHYLD
ncbi:MAG: hypothetical protein ACR2H1_05760, partial [Limisphaerales bacterium]